MIQDIIPYRFHNEYENRSPVAEDIVFCFRGREILMKEDAEGVLCFPTVKECLQEELIYLFRIDDRAFYLGEGAELEEYAWMPVRSLRRLKPKELCFAGMTALHLFEWYRDNRFCGRCGHKLLHSPNERMLRCPDCSLQVYPKIAPAVIVGVRDHDRIMMTHYAPGTGHSGAGNALIAGFCEIGETAEETVRREVMEEVGLHVTNIRYYKSQPWGFASNLLLGYFCDVDGTREVHIDDKELSQARWVSREEIGQEPEELSLTADMIMHFKREAYAGKHAALPEKIKALWKDHVPGQVQKGKKDYAIVIPLIEKEDGYHILYEERSHTLIHQPGEICFPGGKVEVGETAKEAALRETAEELMVHADQLDVIAALDPALGPDGSGIWPFVAVLHGYEGTYSAEEVDHTFSVPVSWFLENAPDQYQAKLVTKPGKDFPYDLIPGGKNYPFREKKHKMLFYRREEGTIWGVTARITSEFIKSIL